MTLADYLRVLRKKWLTVVSLTVLGALAGAGVTMLMPRVYAANTTNFVSSTAATTQPNSLYQNSQFALDNVASYTGLVHSPSVLRPVIDKLHLKMTVPDLATHVTAVNPTSTVLIDVTVTSRSPGQAASIADEVSRQLGATIEKLEKPRGGGSSAVAVSVAMPATTPTAPISPRPKLNVALGLLIGLFVGACVAILRDHFDTSVNSPEDLQRLSGVAALGTVPYDPTTSDRPLLAMRSEGLAVESYRTIRTNLQFVDVDNSPRQVVITSALGGEGKTVTACNLALTLAQGARRVCLVEGDLRLPKAARYLGLNGTIGLTNVVAGQYLLDDVLIPWNRGQITVLPSGTTPPDPSQLLGSRAVRDILARLREQFDIVVIDAPPVLPVTDAAVLSAISDGAILVVRQNQTRQDTVTSALEHLRNAHVHLTGTVLNGVKAKRGAKPYGHVGPYRQQHAMDDMPLTTAESVARRRRAAAEETDATTLDVESELLEPHADSPADMARRLHDLRQR